MKKITLQNRFFLRFISTKALRRIFTRLAAPLDNYRYSFYTNEYDLLYRVLHNYNLFFPQGIRRIKMGNVLCFDPLAFLPGQEPEKEASKVVVDKFKDTKKVSKEIAEEINRLRKNPREYAKELEKHLERFSSENPLIVTKDGIPYQTQEGKEGNAHVHYISVKIMILIFKSFFSHIIY